MDVIVSREVDTDEDKFMAESEFTEIEGEAASTAPPEVVSLPSDPTSQEPSHGEINKLQN